MDGEVEAQTRAKYICRGGSTWWCYSFGEGMKKRVMRPSASRLQLQTPVMI
jgi:hypothetical protein